MEAHNIAVHAIALRVRDFYESQRPFRIYHGSTNSTRRSGRQLDNTIDTSGLGHVLQIDEAKKIALVEPNVPMDALVEATLRHGLVAPVVMEFPGITVGGGFSGTSGESSSFRYGTFDSTVNAIEIVLANGEVTRASKVEKTDLFWGAASAFGTLGVVTLLEVQLVPAKSYVELTYHIAASITDATSQITEAMSAEGIDYIDGIVFSADSAVICTGRLVDSVPGCRTPRRFFRARDRWFYLHVWKVLRKVRRRSRIATYCKPIVDYLFRYDRGGFWGRLHVRRVFRRMRRRSKTRTDYVPIVDYLFRYDRGGFWGGQYAFRYFFTPCLWITRFMLDPFLRTRVMYRAMHQSGLSDFYMVQDVGIPYHKVEEFQVWLDRSFGIYPLWLCPLKLSRDSPGSSHGLHSEFGDPNTPGMLNFGIWGPISFNRRRVVEANRALEQKVQELGGKKWLYAHAYYTEDEFWAHYDRKSYDALRAKYSATYLPSVYDKVKVDVEAEEAAIRASWVAWLLALLWSIWPLRGLYGVYKAIRGGDYLLQKQGGRPETRKIR